MKISVYIIAINTIILSFISSPCAISTLGLFYRVEKIEMPPLVTALYFFIPPRTEKFVPETMFELDNIKSNKNYFCLLNTPKVPQICKKKAHFKSLHLIQWLFQSLKTILHLLNLKFCNHEWYSCVKNIASKPIAW